MKTIIIGSAERANAAIKIPHSVRSVPLIFISPNGMVRRLLLEVNTSANINSFQQYIPVSKALVAIIGLLNGITMLVKTLKELHPSIYAASSNSFGILKKYALIRNTVKEIRKAKYGITIAK